MTEFKINKKSVRAWVHMVDGSILEGTVHVLPRVHTGTAWVPERIPDLADDTEPFLPFHATDNEFILVGKGSLAAVHVQEEYDDDPGFWRRVPAKILLHGGHELVGQLVVEGAPQARLSDELNGPDNWIRVEREEGGVTWIRKSTVIAMRFFAQE